MYISFLRYLEGVLNFLANVNSGQNHYLLLYYSILTNVGFLVNFVFFASHFLAPHTKSL